MDDGISRNKVLSVLDDWIDYNKQILAKCKELGCKGPKYPVYNDAMTRIELLLDLMDEIEGL